MKSHWIALAAAALCALATPLHAHHGVAAYDMTTLTSVTGTVREFDWSNPHATIYIEAPDDKGAVRKWEVETNSPNLLNRAGWTRDTVKPGMQMTIFGFKGKDGQPFRLRIAKLLRRINADIKFSFFENICTHNLDSIVPF